jgi:predicted phosphodiesterase
MSLAFLGALCILSSPVRIVVIGDRTGGSNDPEFEASLQAAALLCPDVAVNVGDLIEGYSEDAAELSTQWDHVLAILDGYLRDTPLVLVPGNHDITYDAAEGVWRERTGVEPSRVAELEGVVFVVWDTSRMGWPDSAEIAGLEGLLEGVGRSETAVLLTHQPFWMMEGDTATARRIRDLAEQYDLEAVIGGHIHTWSSESSNGVLYVSTCTCGGDFGSRDVASGRFTEIAWLTLDGDSASIAVVDPHGIYPPEINTVEEENLLFSIENRLLDFRPLESALESATLTLHNVEEVPRTVAIEVQPGSWGLSPDSLLVDLAAGETRSVYLSQSPSGSPWPAPVVTASVEYGPRNKTASLEAGWPVLRSLRVPEAEVTIDGIRSADEYPGPVEMEFASPDGGRSAIGETSMAVSRDGGRLCVHCSMTLPGGATFEDEAFAVVICVEDVVFRVKVFPDGGVSAITGGPSGISPLDSGFEAAAIAGEGAWDAEIALDLGEIGMDGDSVPANFYRLGAGGESASWTWPLEFDARHMGIVETGR